MSSFKIVVIGDPKSGKTIGLRQFFNIHEPVKRLEEAYVPTIGADVLSTIYRGITLNFWDTAGNSSFGCLPEGYYHTTDLVIVVSDHPQEWIDKYREGCRKIGDACSEQAHVLIYPPFGIPKDLFRPIINLFRKPKISEREQKIRRVS